MGEQDGCGGGDDRVTRLKFGTHDWGTIRLCVGVWGESVGCPSGAEGRLTVGATVKKN